MVRVRFNPLDSIHWLLIGPYSDMMSICYSAYCLLDLQSPSVTSKTCSDACVGTAAIVVGTVLAVFLMAL
jgi:hypothetical protein